MKDFLREPLPWKMILPFYVWMFIWLGIFLYTVWHVKDIGNGTAVIILFISIFAIAVAIPILAFAAGRHFKA